MGFCHVIKISLSGARHENFFRMQCFKLILLDEKKRVFTYFVPDRLVIASKKCDLSASFVDIISCLNPGGSTSSTSIQFFV